MLEEPRMDAPPVVLMYNKLNYACFSYWIVILSKIMDQFNFHFSQPKKGNRDFQIVCIFFPFHNFVMLKKIESDSRHLYFNVN